ncbi:MAG: radical SAM protein [Candidatus Krumholzibacteria bacterium]
MKQPGALLQLSEDCSLKRLETPVVYRGRTDELYEIDEEALAFLNQPSVPGYTQDPRAATFLKFCLDEGILVPADGQRGRTFNVDPSVAPPLPSLRYLLLHLTFRCNLKCKHCYTAPAVDQDLPLTSILELMDQMVDMQGLTVLLSGGEPLTHPNFWELNNYFTDYDLRFELLTNGTEVTPDVARCLNVDLAQVSIDGTERGHDFLRGRGSYKRSLSGIKALRAAGIPVAIATMVHGENRNDFPELAKLWESFEITDWIINAPSELGRWRENSEHAVPIQEAAEIMLEYSYGEGPHLSKSNFTCGSHICSVFPNGEIYPCPFLHTEEMLIGNIREVDLRSAWVQRKGVTQEMLTECQDCRFLEECRGGCRFRAQEHSHICGKDPVLCAIFGVES